MTGKERIVKAMDHKKADRVPFFCQLSLGHYMLNTEYEPYKIWHSPEIFKDALFTLAERYGMDGILVNLPGRPLDWEEHIVKKERKEAETILHWDDGTTTRCPDNDNAHHISGKELPSFEEVAPEKLYYIEPHNITGIKYPFYYDFDDTTAKKTEDAGKVDREHFFPSYLTRTIEYVVKKAGREYHVSSEVFSPFTQIMELLGYTDGLMALVTEPEKCEAILQNLAEGTADLALRQAGAGPDAVLVSSPFAGGGFISREHYQQFVFPFEKYVIDQVHENTDLPIYVHTCGAIGDRVDLMAEAGYDGVDTMDPPPLGNTDIAKVKQELGEKLFLKGNVDPVNIIRNGTPEMVYNKAVELIKSAGVGGGYILSSACSVAPQAPPENIRRLYQAAADHPY